MGSAHVKAACKNLGEMDPSGNEMLEMERKIEGYRAFHRFGQSQFPHGGLVLGSSQISILPPLPPKIMLDSKVVKMDTKIKS